MARIDQSSSNSDSSSFFTSSNDGEKKGVKKVISKSQSALKTKQTKHWVGQKALANHEKSKSNALQRLNALRERCDKEVDLSQGLKRNIDMINDKL